MSHVVDCDIVIKDLEAFKEACQELGLVFKENQQTYKWFGKWMNDYSSEDAAYKRAGIKPEDYGKCAHAASVKGNSQAYELGLVPNPKGEGFVLIFDFWGNEGKALQKVIGDHAAKLKSVYGTKVVTRMAKRKGYDVAEVVMHADGRVKQARLVKRR